MVVVNKRAPSLGGFSQERMSKDDLRLLLQLIDYNTLGIGLPKDITMTRLEMLIGKLKRMLK